MPDEDAVATQIVSAARVQFLRSGYSRISTAGIARSVGRSKKTLYKHFASKEALLQAVLAQAAAETGREIAALRSEGGSDRLARLRRILILAATQLATTHRVLFADLRCCEPELGERVWREHRQALLLTLRPILAAAMADGTLRDDLPAEPALALFLACIEGLTLSPLAAPVTSDPVATLVGLLVDGLRRR